MINTAKTIVTFLMVFLIQNMQNRDALAIHLKLDELLRAVGPARSGLVSLEDLCDEDLARLKHEFASISQQHDGHVKRDDEIADTIQASSTPSR